MRAVMLVAVLAALVGCVQDELDRSEPLPALDPHFFRCEVQPVLASSCAFMACHGNDERPFSVYAEQRYRLGISWRDYETPLTDEELAANLEVVSGFVARDGSDEHLLSEKPLDTRAGGWFHRGRDLFGDADVFLTRDDARYQVLRDFAAGATAQPSCAPREDLGL